MNISAQFNLGKPATAGRVEAESTMRILILGDWLGDTPAPGSFDERSPVNIDIDRFQQVMTRLAPSLVLDEHDNLVFADIEDFHPDRLCRNLFQLKNLLLLYKGLDDPARIRELMAEMKVAESDSGTGAQSSDQGTDLERLLGGRPPEQDQDNPAVDQIRKLMQEVVSPHLVDTRAVEPHRQAITARLNEQLDAVLHDPRFQSLEANWRGLWWLVSQLVSEEVQIALLPMTRAEFVEDLQSAGTQLDNSALHQHLLGSPNQPPWSMVVGLYEFGEDVDDIMALCAAALIAEAAGAPFVASARPGLVGCKDMNDLVDPARWQPGPEGQSLELWQSLQQSSSGQWIGLVLPRFLTPVALSVRY
jgi:type VI secretion system protein ImpC